MSAVAVLLGLLVTPPSVAIDEALAPLVDEAALGVPGRLVVQGDGVRAVISTRPFRISTFDAHGRVVVNQVANERPAPLVGTTLEQPGGADSSDDRALYSPFTFEVGLGAVAQFPASPWVGALIGAGRAGIQYSARDVVAYRTIGGGLELTVSTNDPLGRQLVVRVRAADLGTMSVSMRVTPDLGVSAVATSFVSPAGEAFHGFGGRHTRVDQRGRTLTGWIQAQNVSAGQLQPGVDQIPGTGDEEYLFPNWPSAASATRPPTSPSPAVCHPSFPTCSIAPSGAPGGTPRTSEATSTSSPAPSPRSCSPGGTKPQP